MSGPHQELDLVFKALADPTRRLMLDRLRERNGQTLTDLCAALAMARQSATQHLDLLVQAGLVTVVRRGRERLHYLNPVPIHEIEERWISGFDKPRLLAKMKAVMGDKLTTIFVRQGHYALEADMSTIEPKPDVTIERIGDLLALDRTAFTKVA